jgi:hypothetical protein
MSLEPSARLTFPAWSNPLTWWWGLLAIVSGANIAVWLLLYWYLQEPPSGSFGAASDVYVMLLLSGAYVCGCAFPLDPSACRCSADMLVRYVAFERNARPVSRNRSGDMLRDAMGDYSPASGYDGRSKHDLERRVGDRTLHIDRSMFLMAWGADQELSEQRYRKFHMGHFLHYRWDWRLPFVARV